MNLNSMLAQTWRFCNAVCDWRRMLRKLSGDTSFDLAFITNMRDQTDVDRFIGDRKNKVSFFYGPRLYLGKTFSFKGIAGQVISLTAVTEECMHSSKKEEVKAKFVAATRHAVDKGAKIILLAAATKRMFGRNGQELKRMFPDTIFTIGDNGTALVLLAEVFNAINTYRLGKGARIAVLGPYGILGRAVVDALMRDGRFEVIGIGASVNHLKSVQKEYKINVFDSFQDVENVDMVIACTHSNGAALSATVADMIRRKNRKLVVVDVAEPSNLSKDEYARCANFVVRQDAGNAYNKDLKYVLGAVSYRMFRLTKGVTFGCFAEAMALAYTCKTSARNIQMFDWFSVDDRNLRRVSILFDECRFVHPTPRCFGRRVKRADISKAA